MGVVVQIRSLFGYPKYLVPYYNRDPKRDHNFDNPPMGFCIRMILWPLHEGADGPFELPQKQYMMRSPYHGNILHVPQRQPSKA